MILRNSINTITNLSIAKVLNLGDNSCTCTYSSMQRISAICSVTWGVKCQVTSILKCQSISSHFQVFLVSHTSLPRLFHFQVSFKSFSSLFQVYVKFPLSFFHISFAFLLHLFGISLASLFHLFHFSFKSLSCLFKISFTCLSCLFHVFLISLSLLFQVSFRI